MNQQQWDTFGSELAGVLGVFIILIAILLGTAHASTCDSSYPKGIHGHQIAATYSIKLVGDKEAETPDFIDSAAQVFNQLLNGLAKATKADISFVRVKKDSDANLVFRTTLEQRATDGALIAQVHAFGLGKSDQLFVVQVIQPLKQGEDPADVALKAYATAIALAFRNINSGWQCDASASQF